MKNDVITKANDAYSSDSPRHIDKLLDYKAFQAKKISTAELLKLADEFDKFKLWDDVEIQSELNKNLASRMSSIIVVVAGIVAANANARRVVALKTAVAAVPATAVIAEVVVIPYNLFLLL